MPFNENLVRSIDLCRPRPGQCAFWWLGQMGLAVRTASMTLWFDPFLTPAPERRFLPPLAAEHLTNADIIFGSHDHMDHIDGPVWQAAAVASPGTRFVLPAGLRDVVSDRLGIPAERMTGLSDGMSVDIGNASIQAVAAAHERLNDRNENEIYIVRVDGVTICHMGDTCIYDGLITKLKAAGPIDVLMLPINGRDGQRLFHGCFGNMTWQEAVDLVGEVGPALAIPGHYDMFEGNTEDPALFARYLEIKYPRRDYWIGPHARRIMYPLYD